MHHSFDIEHARLYGLPEAVLIYNLQFWIERNRANGENFREGRTWTYNSVRAFGDLFVYLSPKQVRRTLDSLVTKNVIMAANHNESGRDRTLWYAFHDEVAFLSKLHHLPDPANAHAHNGNSHSPKGANGNAQEGKSLIRTDGKPDGNPDDPAAAHRATKGARLPDAWVLPRAWGVWAQTNPDLTGDWTDDHVRVTAQKFRNYWTAKPGRDAVKLDWFGTWQNWCLNPSSAPGTAQKSNAPWHLAHDTALAKANEVGVGESLPGESKDTWHGRIRAAIDNGGKPPAQRAFVPPSPGLTKAEPRAAVSAENRAALLDAAKRAGANRQLGDNA